jgi:hypothetical protein
MERCLGYAEDRVIAAEHKAEEATAIALSYQEVNDKVGASTFGVNQSTNAYL